jgi:hypothetical protein
MLGNGTFVKTPGDLTKSGPRDGLGKKNYSEESMLGNGTFVKTPGDLTKSGPRDGPEKKDYSEESTSDKMAILG